MENHFERIYLVQYKKCFEVYPEKSILFLKDLGIFDAKF
jgi:hypothetical protein